MNVREIRRAVGQNQKDFAASRNIPIGTLRNWEQGVTNPPDYLVWLLEREALGSMSVNWKSIKLMKTMDELAELAEAGFRDFDKATWEDKDTFILVDWEEADEQGAPIVLDSLIDELHHDAISYYDNLFDDVIFRVVEQGDELFIVVKSLYTNDEVCIDGGRWYFV